MNFLPTRLFDQATTMLVSGGWPLAQSSDSYFVVPHFGPRAKWAAVALLVVFGFVLWLLARRRARPLEVMAGAAGKVHVSKAALADLVEGAAQQYGVVGRPKVSFERRGGKIHLHIRMKLAAGQRLPEFSEGLQTHLTETLRDAFGLTDLGGIHLTVTGFKGDALPEGGFGSKLSSGSGASATSTFFDPAPPADKPSPPTARPGGSFFT